MNTAFATLVCSSARDVADEAAREAGTSDPAAPSGGDEGGDQPTPMADRDDQQKRYRARDSER